MKSSDNKPVRLPSFQEEEDFEAAKTKDNFQSTIDNVDNAVASADQALDIFPS